MEGVQAGVSVKGDGRVCVGVWVEGQALVLGGLVGGGGEESDSVTAILYSIIMVDLMTKRWCTGNSFGTWFDHFPLVQ